MKHVGDLKIVFRTPHPLAELSGSVPRSLLATDSTMLHGSAKSKLMYLIEKVASAEISDASVSLATETS